MPAQHCQLVPQDEDLQFFEVGRPAQQTEKLENALKDDVPRRTRARHLPDTPNQEGVFYANRISAPHGSHDGMICTGESYKNAVKLTFAKGAALPDPSGLFNASLEGNTRRAIDIHEGDRIDATAFKALIRAAVALNAAK